MDPVPPPFSDGQAYYYAGRRSLPPTSVPGIHHIVPTYPSSTLHTYYPSSPSHVAPDNAHISSLPPPFGVLPSVSNERIPSLRQTPSVHHSLSQHLHISPRINSPYQYQQNNVQSRNSPTRHTPDPASFHPTTHSHFQNIAFQTAAAPQTHTAFPIIAPQPVSLPPKLSTIRPSPVSSTSVNSSLHFSHSKFSLPSTKDIPLLSGKYDWGPWHSAVRTLVLNANLLGHIADDPLPGAAYDPGLWPTGIYSIRTPGILRLVVARWPSQSYPNLTSIPYHTW